MSPNGSAYHNNLGGEELFILLMLMMNSPTLLVVEACQKEPVFPCSLMGSIHAGSVLTEASKWLLRWMKTASKSQWCNGLAVLHMNPCLHWWHVLSSLCLKPEYLVEAINVLVL